MLKAVIMAGGRGERFWPQSRVNMPKQCLRILDHKSMVEITVERLKPLFEEKDMYLSTGSHLASFLKQRVPNVNFVIEPCAKNTAACIGLSALTIAETDPNAIMFVETTDHVYKDTALYHKHIQAAAETAKQDKIVVIGIKPDHPHTGFGYIHHGKEIKDIDGIKILELKAFKEKPDLETAEHFLETGEYLWNAGMFISKVSVMLDTMKLLMPDLYKVLMNIKKSKFDPQIIKDEFETLESISIDYGIMEKAQNTCVVRGDLWWYDIGDWDSMELVHPQDKQGNILRAKVEGNSKNCIIFGDTKPIKVENVDNLIIVDTQDSLFICKRHESQRVKEVVKQIEEKNPKWFEDYIDTPQPLYIMIDANKCEAKGNYIIAVVGVDNLVIEKNENEVVIKQK
tara:strand:+ start:4488 stop:5681 length:1194 start_codon:yes stop_codon:yes gene_type:complete